MKYIFMLLLTAFSATSMAGNKAVLSDEDKVKLCALFGFDVRGYAENDREAQAVIDGCVKGKFSVDFKGPLMGEGSEIETCRAELREDGSLLSGECDPL
tara:strand:- start:7720 stop:8016 length:297 start_codon:yes stop_codon:yes gene_type:complete